MIKQCKHTKLYYPSYTRLDVAMVNEGRWWCHKCNTYGRDKYRYIKEDDDIVVHIKAIVFTIAVLFNCLLAASLVNWIIGEFK